MAELLSSAAICCSAFSSPKFPLLMSPSTDAGAAALHSKLLHCTDSGNTCRSSCCVSSGSSVSATFCSSISIKNRNTCTFVGGSTGECVRPASNSKASAGSCSVALAHDRKSHSIVHSVSKSSRFLSRGCLSNDNGTCTRSSEKLRIERKGRRNDTCNSNHGFSSRNASSGSSSEENLGRRLHSESSDFTKMHSSLERNLSKHRNETESSLSQTSPAGAAAVCEADPSFPPIPTLLPTSTTGIHDLSAFVMESLNFSCSFLPYLNRFSLPFPISVLLRLPAANTRRSPAASSNSAANHPSSTVVFTVNSLPVFRVPVQNLQQLLQESAAAAEKDATEIEGGSRELRGGGAAVLFPSESPQRFCCCSSNMSSSSSKSTNTCRSSRSSSPTIKQSCCCSTALGCKRDEREKEDSSCCCYELVPAAYLYWLVQQRLGLPTHTFFRLSLFNKPLQQQALICLTSLVRQQHQDHQPHQQQPSQLQTLDKLSCQRLSRKHAEAPEDLLRKQQQDPWLGQQQKFFLEAVSVWGVQQEESLSQATERTRGSSEKSLAPQDDAEEEQQRQELRFSQLVDTVSEGPLQSQQEPSAKVGSTFGKQLPVVLQLLFFLKGGKGGFGALLKKQRRKQARAAPNFDMSRDLTGRRLRHAQLMDRVKAWMAKKTQEQLAIALLSGKNTVDALRVTEKSGGDGAASGAREEAPSHFLDSSFIKTMRRNALKLPALAAESLQHQQRIAREKETKEKQAQEARLKKGKNALQQCDWYLLREVLTDEDDNEDEDESDRPCNQKSEEEQQQQRQPFQQPSIRNQHQAHKEESKKKRWPTSSDNGGGSDGSGVALGVLGDEGGGSSSGGEMSSSCRQTTTDSSQSCSGRPKSLLSTCSSFRRSRWDCVSRCSPPSPHICSSNGGSGSSNSNSSSSSSRRRMSSEEGGGLGGGSKEIGVREEEQERAVCSAWPPQFSLVSQQQRQQQHLCGEGKREEEAEEVENSGQKTVAARASGNSACEAAVSQKQMTAIRQAAEALKLDEFANAEELERKISAEVIKEKLLSLGWKCGGRPSERAERLFLLKTLQGEDPPAHVLANAARAARRKKAA